MEQKLILGEYKNNILIRGFSFWIFGCEVASRAQ